MAFKGALTSGFRMVEGAVFRTPAPTRAAERRVAKRVGELLGPVLTNEKDVSDLLWRIVGQRVRSGGELEIAKLRASFEAGLKEALAREFTFVDSCQVVVLEEGVDRVSIGPVTVRWSAAVGADLSSKVGATIGDGEPKGFVVSEAGKVSFNFWPNCWTVSVNASPKNVPEEAAWLIDIAVSLLRLSHEASTVFYPKYGEVEAAPIAPTSVAMTSVIIHGDRWSSGGSRIPGHYRIGPDVAKLFEAKAFVQRATAVFARKKGSLAERVAQGLGWLARGRRSEDRTERFLFFFTAIEALLSSDDTKAPVIQTIARHAAVLLVDDPAARARTAKQVRDLYGFRSALVHTGARNVSKTSADTTQMLAETLYWHVLELADLSQKYSVFCGALSDASYGTTWPPDSK